MTSTDEKLKQLINRLREKSERGEVGWESDAGSETQYFASFPGYSVAIERTERQNGTPIFTFSILDKSGSKLESISIDDAYYNMYWDRPYDELSSIFKDARRKAMNVEQALDDILRVL